MWTPTILSIDQDGDTPVVIFGVEFTNGKVTKTETIKTSEPESIVTILRNRVKQMNKISDYLANPIALGPVDLSEEITLPAQTPILDLMKMKQAVDLGLKSQEDYDTLLSSVKDTVVLENLPTSSLI